MKTERERFAEARAAALEEERERVLRVNQNISSHQRTTQEQSSDKDLVNIQSNCISLMITLYKNKYGKNPDYQEPIKSDGESASFFFQSGVEEALFCIDVAPKVPEPFVVLNAEKTKVLGYSTSDGLFYHADGTKCEKGEQLKSEGVELQDFKHPDQSSYRP